MGKKNKKKNREVETVEPSDHGFDLSLLTYEQLKDLAADTKTALVESRAARLAVTREAKAAYEATKMRRAKRAE